MHRGSPRGVLIALLALVAASLSALGAPVASAEVDAGPAVVTATTPFWADEFDGAAGSRPDHGTWTTETGNRRQQGWWNNELQYYTREAANARIDRRGHLRISARRATRGQHLPCHPRGQCRDTSARLTTAGTVSLAYGRIDVRAKLPTGRGLLPAIWMLGENGEVWPAQGEIDVVEVVGHEPRTVHGTAHGPGYFNEGGLGGTTRLPARADAGFHVYSVVKEPDRIAWLVDGRTYFTLTPDDLPPRGRWVFEQDMHLLLNVAVGGDWPGDPSKATGFPASMRVDYVRLFGSGTVEGQPVRSPS